MQLIKSQITSAIPLLNTEINLIILDLKRITINMSELWMLLDMLTNDSTTIIAIGTNPVSAQFITSKLSMYKYDIVWEKTIPSNPFQMKRQVGVVHEYLHVFYKSKNTFNAQINYKKRSTGFGFSNQEIRPRSIWKFKEDNHCDKLHKAQKPIQLLEDVIRTFSNRRDVVLDITMGSGTTGVACKNLNRDFIGIEDGLLFETAKNRINESHQ